MSASSRKHPPTSTLSLRFRAANASLLKHNFHLLLALERSCVLFTTLVRHECTSSRGRTERPTMEATASEFSACGLATVSLAPIYHHAEHTDCADRTTDAARNCDGLGNAGRSGAERGSSKRRLFVAPARRRQAVLCSVIPCATPFRLSGKNDTYFEE